MIPLTTPIENIHRYLNMYMENFYMNIMVLFLSKTCKIFLSVTKLTLSNAGQIIYALEAKKIPHESPGFKITDFHGDNEFNIQDLRYYLRPLTVKIYSKDEHVVFIKKAKVTVKERTRFMCHYVP